MLHPLDKAGDPSSDPGRGDVDAVVCVATFRRPAMLARTLASLEAQRTVRSVRVVVVDNDADGRAGLAVARERLRDGPLRGVALVEPRQGNCHAINAAFRAAGLHFPQAAFVMMIDDDEVASPDWIDGMIDAAERNGADVVGGPVFPVFDRDPGRAIGRHPVFWPAFAASGPVPRIYGSGNFLIRHEALRRLDATFDAAFNFLGGGDTDFFFRCGRAGLRFYWNQEARIEEIVPASRTTAGWVARRSLRTGAINYHVERRHATSPAARARVHLKNLLALPYGLLRAAACFVRTGSPLLASHRPLMAAGRLCASLGFEPEQYRATPKHRGPCG